MAGLQDTPAVPSTAQTRALTAASASGAACPVISDGDESSSTSTVIGGSQPATKMPVPSAALPAAAATAVPVAPPVVMSSPAPRAAAVKIEASGGAGGAQVAEELEEWRYAAVPVTVLGLPDEVMSSPIPGFDDISTTLRPASF